MKILILKPSSLGDIVQALPVLRLLKQHWPESEIYWWIEVSSAPLLEGDPDLAGISRFDRARWASPWHYGEIWRNIRELRQHRFDLVIDLQALARSGAVAWLANGAFTIGLLDWREGAPGFYDLSVPRPSRDTHAVDWYLRVLAELRVPVHWNFNWLPERKDVARELNQIWSTNGKNWIVLQPGARWPNKRWPAEYFRDMVRLHRARDSQARFVVLGGTSDRELGQTICAAAPDVCLDLTGRTTLPQMVEWIRLSKLVVTNDTGPMHVAAALDKPVVGLFGPTNPARTGPYGQINRVLQRRELPCVPCMKDTCSYSEPMACLRGISPERAAQEVAMRLGRRSADILSASFDR